MLGGGIAGLVVTSSSETRDPVAAFEDLWATVPRHPFYTVSEAYR
jgi:hypothetical protein